MRSTLTSLPIWQLQSSMLSHVPYPSNRSTRALQSPLEQRSSTVRSNLAREISAQEHHPTQAIANVTHSLCGGRFQIAIIVLAAYLSCFQCIQYAPAQHHFSLLFNHPYANIAALSLMFPIVNMLCIATVHRFVCRTNVRASACLAMMCSAGSAIIKHLSFAQPSLSSQYSAVIVAQLLAAVSTVILLSLVSILLSPIRHKVSVRHLILLMSTLTAFVVLPLLTISVPQLSELNIDLCHFPNNIMPPPTGLTAPIVLSLSKALRPLFIVQAIVTTVLTILVFCLVENPSPKATDHTQNDFSSQSNIHLYTDSSIIRSGSFLILLLVLAYNAIACSTFYLQLNQWILIDFPNQEYLICSLAVVFCVGAIGGLCFSWYLSFKTCSKEVAFAVYGFSVLFWILFMFKLHFSSPELRQTRLNSLVDGNEIANLVVLHLNASLFAFFAFVCIPIICNLSTQQTTSPSSSRISWLLLSMSSELASVLSFPFIANVLASSGTMASNAIVLLCLCVGLFLLGTSSVDSAIKSDSAHYVPILSRTAAISYQATDNRHLPSRI